MTAVALPSRTSVRRPSIERFVLDALARAAEARAIAVVRVPAFEAPPAALSAGLRKGTSVSWRPPRGPQVATHGAAATLRFRGRERFAAFAPQARALFAAMDVSTHPDVAAAAPRLYGGWSFAPGSADDAPWEGFGDGCFVLPRWSYEHDPTTTPALTLAIDLRQGWPGGAARLRAELATVWEALARPLPPPRPTSLRVDHAAQERWRAQVDAITDAIARRHFDKVVSARRATVFSTHDLEPWAVERALAERHPDTWCYSLRFGAGTFLGATPERLFVKRGRTLETDALAGSIGVDGVDAEATLRGSLKDRREHRPVVEHLVERLAPLCTTLDAPSEPRVRRLPDVLHLHTTLRGTLAPDVHAAQLVEALHPTPAVGGVPGAAATEWIVANEAHPRGWYAGPLGWIDAEGDAELTVALRCGVIRGNTAWAWAGGGIVEGSEPDAEWEESALKLRPLLAALESA